MAKIQFTDDKNEAVAFAEWLAFEQKGYVCLYDTKTWLYGLEWKDQLTTEEMYEKWKKVRK